MQPTDDQLNELQDIMATGTPLQKVNAVIGQCAALCDQVLADDPMAGFTRLWLGGELKKLRARLAAQSGAPIPGGDLEPAGSALQPLTRMFGQSLNRVAPVTSAEVRPGDMEQMAFRNKRDQFAQAFPSRTDDQILEFVGQPGGEVLIRAVAKISGVENYADAPIDVAYIQEIRDLMAETQRLNDADNAAQQGAINLANKRAQGSDQDDDDQDPGDEDDDQEDVAGISGPPVKLGGHTTADDLLNGAAAAGTAPKPEPIKSAAPKKAVPPVPPGNRNLKTGA